MPTYANVHSTVGLCAEKTAKYARDMKNAGVKLDDESKLKIKAAMDVISEKFDEIRNNII